MTAKAPLVPDVRLEPPLRLESVDPRAATGPLPGAPSRVAVIVAHGMGQQLRFETLEQVARALLPWASRPDVAVREVRIGEERLHRAEIEVDAGPGRAARQVHLYEAYWAPLAEGRISARETVAFLVRAGVDGIRTARRPFRRWMFGRLVTLKALPRTVAHLLFTLVFIGALALLRLTIPAMLGASLLGVGAGNAVFEALRVPILWANLLGIVVLGGAGLAVGAMHRARMPAGKPAVEAVRALIWVALATPVLAALALVWTAGAAAFAPAWLPAWRELGRAHWPVALSLWALVTIVSRRVEHFLTQYVGDVAIYLSGHRVSRFHETRGAIKAAAASVFRAVYTARTPGAAALEYDHIVVAGHSLGSVVAYDTLNAMLNEDTVGQGVLRVRERTKLLLTFGSPLDKTAFLFRAQADESSVIREALAASVQPMIQTPDRPAWINLHSRNDWISGAIDYYDETPDSPGHVVNREDPAAATPLAAHVEYWRGRMLAEVLHAGITAADPGRAGEALPNP